MFSIHSQTMHCSSGEDVGDGGFPEFTVGESEPELVGKFVADVPFT